MTKRVKCPGEGKETFLCPLPAQASEAVHSRGDALCSPCGGADERPGQLVLALYQQRDEGRSTAFPPSPLDLPPARTCTLKSMKMFIRELAQRTGVSAIPFRNLPSFWQYKKSRTCRMCECENPEVATYCACGKVWWEA